jgi:hypothetical protein
MNNWSITEIVGLCAFVFIAPIVGLFCLDKFLVWSRRFDR